MAVDGSLKAVSLVTSFDTKKPVLEAATRTAREALTVERSELVRAHESVWSKFWSASGMELEDRFFQWLADAAQLVSGGKKSYSQTSMHRYFYDP